jgi:8-oxo-dGTP pyrophosphatase MutT (NUDIX family)
MKKEYSFWIIPVFKEDNWSKEILIVQSKNWSHRWFPKWHKAKWEKPLETAIRELFEETWLKIKQIINWELIEDPYIDYSQISKNWKTIEKHVWYFIWEVKSKKIKLQKKEIKDALRLAEDKIENNITHDSSKKIFQQAKSIINNI